MQKFTVLEVLSNVVTTEPETTYFLLLKFLKESVCEDNLAIMASECLDSVLYSQILESDQALTLVY